MLLAIRKCHKCIYFSRSRDSECLKFGKRFVEGFYSILECRRDETKCGLKARWFLEKKVTK